MSFVRWFSAQVLAEARKVRQNASVIGLAVWAFWGLGALPYAALHHGLKIWIRRKDPAVRRWQWEDLRTLDRLDPAYTRLYVDLWNIGWFLLTACGLAFMIARDPFGRWPRDHLFWWWCLVLIFPVGRLFNIVHTLFTLLATNDPIRSRSRAITALLVHYVEIIIAFAFVYLSYQASNAAMLFYVETPAAPTRLTPFQAFDLSVRIASTLGPGGAIPLSRVGIGFSLITFSELLVVLFVTIVSIPRHLR